MAGKTKPRLQLEQVFLHYRDEDGKKRVVKLRIDGLDSVIFSREVADRIRSLFPPGGEDPEEPGDETRVMMASSGSAEAGDQDGEDDEEGDTGNCYIVNGNIICV